MKHYDAIEAERALTKALAEALRESRTVIASAYRANVRDLYDSKEELEAAILEHVTIKKIDAAITAYEARTEQPSAVSDVMESAKEEGGASAPLLEETK